MTARRKEASLMQEINKNGTAADRVSHSIGFPCESCGHQMSYAPSSEGLFLFCSYCRTQKPIESEKKDAPEYLYFPDRDEYEAPRWEEMGRRVLTCPSCGADTLLSPAAVTASCPFCSANYVTEPHEDDNVILPETMMPFRISHEVAQTNFSAWVKKRWLAPQKFRNGKFRPDMKGIYVPFWTFDASVSTRYNGYGGRRRTVTYTARVNGKTVTRTRTVTDWYPISGDWHMEFDDMAWPGTDRIDRRLFEKLGPYSMKVLHVYDPAFLAGFFAERYSIGLAEGFARVREMMAARVRHTIERALGYDTYRGMSYDHRFDRVRFKHILLPLWLAAYRFRGKVYQLMVNGETGQVSARSPLSVWKILGLVLLGVGVAAGLVWLAMNYLG